MTVLPLLLAILSQVALPTVTSRADTYLERTTVAADGTATVTREPLKYVKRGDRVLIESHITNPNPTVQRDVYFMIPLDRALEFVSADADAALSVDGGAGAWGPLAKLTVREAGKTRPARPADVRYVRWTIPSVAAGATVLRSVRGVVR